LVIPPLVLVACIRLTPRWYANHRKEIELPALNPFVQAASPRILAEYEEAPDCIEALGALNRWPGRTGIPIEIASPRPL
jgi:hypothetical protein